MATRIRNQLARYIPEYRGHSSECWIWQGCRTPQDYGIICEGRKLIKAYRYFYEKIIGPIPAGLVIDHLCRVKPCVNPYHLEPVTAAENTRRMNEALRQSRLERAAQLTHCFRGHPLSEENILPPSKGKMTPRCRKCRAEISSKYNALASREKKDARNARDRAKRACR